MLQLILPPPDVRAYETDPRTHARIHAHLTRRAIRLIARTAGDDDSGSARSQTVEILATDGTVIDRWAVWS